MTTIAWDGKILAADSQMSSSFIDPLRISKIRRVDDLIFGLAGGAGMMDAFTDFLKGNEDRSRFDRVLKNFSAIVIGRGKVLFYCDDLEPIECGTPQAIGSGEQFAMGAMFAGATAEQAVLIAIKLDTGSGAPVETMTA